MIFGAVHDPSFTSAEQARELKKQLSRMKQYGHGEPGGGRERS